MSKFSAVVDDLFTRLKAGEPALVDRPSRIALIDAEIERYFAETGKMPDGTELERLGTLILNEELTDARKNKMQEEDEPIMSDSQYARRTEGRHKRKNQSKEVGFGAAQTVGVDGKNYRMPVRKYS